MLGLVAPTVGHGYPIAFYHLVISVLIYENWLVFRLTLHHSHHIEDPSPDPIDSGKPARSRLVSFNGSGNLPHIMA